jgi:hypothetical protein
MAMFPDRSVAFMLPHGDIGILTCLASSIIPPGHAG